MRETQHVFFENTLLCDLDTARYKARLQSRTQERPASAYTLINIQNNKTPAAVEIITFYSGRGRCFDLAIYCLMIALFL